MMPFMLLMGATLVAGADTAIRFSRINPDSIAEVKYSAEGYTSRSTTAIYARMKNGDSVNILYDKEARLSPMSLTLSKNMAWLTDPICEGSEDNCVELLCSLPQGVCKDAKIIGDSGYTFNGLSDSAAGGADLINKKKRVYEKLPGKKKKVRTFATKYITDSELTEQFLRKPGTPLRIHE